MKRLIAAVALFLPLAASIPTTAPARKTLRTASVKPAQGMVSAADPRAVAAGVEILNAGGSATDAAIATMLALNVVEPQSSGMGGGTFFVRHDAATGRISTIDGREAAPAAADDKWFYDAKGNPLPHDAAVPGGRSVGVPGQLRVMAMAHAQSGKLPWARLFQPAIRLARDGAAASPRMVVFLGQFARFMSPAARAIFFDANGKPVAAGAIIKNPAQAELFDRVARLGPDAFYKGATAGRIVAAVNNAPVNPSKMTVADIAEYRAKPRPALCGMYRAYKVCSMGPPSSGGFTVLMILKQLERFDMARLGKDSPVAWHLFAQSSRLAYADRDMYLGDPDFISIPLAGLLSPKYIAARSALISPDRSIDKPVAGIPAGAPPRKLATPRETPGTTDLVVTDKAGNVVEVTTTIEGVWGSGLNVDGIMLNNELTDFDIVPAKDGYLVANRVQPGKRPRSSMAPTIVYGPDGKVRLALGAAGGSTIIAQVAKAIVGVIDWKMSAQDAIGMGLIYAPGQTAIAEAGTPVEGMVPALRALGEKIVVGPLGLKANAIERIGGQWVGAADPRSEGIAMSQDGRVADIRRFDPKGSRPPE
jgi:gamma-glutamyltranspeptidase/glutathione hydrolase